MTNPDSDRIVDPATFAGVAILLVIVALRYE